MLGDKIPQPSAPDTPDAPETSDKQPEPTPAQTTPIPSTEPDSTSAPVQTTATAVPIQRPTPVEPTRSASPAEPAEQTEMPVESAEPADRPDQLDQTEIPVASVPASHDYMDRFDALDDRLNDVDAHLDAFDTRLETLDQCIDGLRKALDDLSGAFSRRLRYDDAKEKVIDRQHEELHKLRDGLTLDLREPVLQDLASALAKINTMKGELSDGNTEAKDMLEDIDYMLGAILDDYDVARVDSEPGSRYNAARQRFLPKDVELTDDPDKSRTIARSKAPGYVYEAGERPRVLLKEQVVMYKVVKPASPTAEPAPTGDTVTSDAPSSIG